MVYSSSIEVRPEWQVIEQMDFASLNRLSSETIPKPVDLYLCGQLEFYDKAYDLVNPRAEKPIGRTQRVPHDVTTSDDPLMR